MSYLKKQGNNGPIWALIAFDSHAYEIPEGDVTREALIAYILDVHLEDGGWALSGTVSDVDMTAMAIQALAPYYDTDADVKAAVDEGLAWLSQVQMADGGYLSADGYANCESSAQVIVALTALGIDPENDTRFVKNGISVVDAMCGFYVEGGGFKHLADGALDGMATEQGYYALTSYFRLLKGETSLYDMTDVEIEKNTELPFVDVPENTWYRDAVEFVYWEGIMKGVETDTFDPYGTLTRAQFVTILYRMAGTPAISGASAFTDVLEGRYYTDAVIWATENGITKGIGNDLFDPYAAVTRQQMVTFLYRYAQYTGADVSEKADLSGYTDADSVPGYAREAMAWAVGNEIILGVSQTQLDPRATATRAQAAKVVQRLYENRA